MFQTSQAFFIFRRRQSVRSQVKHGIIIFLGRSCDYVKDHRESTTTRTAGGFSTLPPEAVKDRALNLPS